MDVFKKVEAGIDAVFGGEKHSHSRLGQTCDHLHPVDHVANRFQSFAAPSTGNVKWYVDGCSYFWAVSDALEQARESIFILGWWLSPEVFLRRPPSKNEKYRLDNMLKAAAERGVKVHVIVYKEVKQALALNSSHTKHALEKLHPNVSVFRHPDHTPDGYELSTELGPAANDLSHRDLAKASSGAIKALYGSAGDVVLFWAHHEKLVVVDRKIGFMGGLDLCFGRYDTNSHPIADAHPGDLDAIVFPGQDYNNARVLGFSKVQDWDQNKLDRTKTSRMGWSDVALSMNGAIVGSLVEHFVDRWQVLSIWLLLFMRTLTAPGTFCSKWSSGHKTEHSIANAYIDAITNATHFVYIENQFFITASSDEQHPIANKIAYAIVDRISKADKENQSFRVWVVIPAVPGFAGDLKADCALATRAIMQFQYCSISRGGHSIIEKLREAGVEDPRKYIGFYNLRNFDRINTSKTMQATEERAGRTYEEARKEHDDAVGAENSPEGEGGGSREKYEIYQREAAKVEDKTLDTISPVYMDGDHRIANLHWDSDPEDEIQAFVSEELYVHSKILIADDRLVICGSANLSDRSQLGTHDSEIAVVIEDPTPVDSFMNGRPYKASKFATSLRRYIFRKHLGLLPDQRWDKPDDNWRPVDQCPNSYDWGSPADILVRDPLHSNFQSFWGLTAKTNTEIFRRAFHPVPDDNVRTWAEYEKFFESRFVIPGNEEDGKKSSKKKNKGKVEYGHIVPGEFPGGLEEVRALLGCVRGNLVEMPLNFLVDVGCMAKTGWTLNSLTDELYT
ncbi:Phospholipase D1 [Tolypocladium ophioglossoides CBS 100239]|uniref:phospholipase D n=1 Tax=Tolypocladium ophioglossoides (strain CBS 100239) TaxID=1163406 RepID=A0A0L0NGR5_TOLOC|nr:Phospholipase D1 [Tolypocladium ophioglossoides CBS 100239]